MSGGFMRRWLIFAVMGAAFWTTVAANLGYPPLSGEVMGLVALSAFAGALLAALFDPMTPRGGIVVGMLGSFALLMQTTVGQVPHLLVGIGVACIVLFGARHPRPLTMMTLAALVAGMVGALLQPLPLIETQHKASVGADAIPSVIHILLDEHASDWGLPDEAISSIDRQALWDNYSARGFTLFDRGYSNHNNTPQSVASLFNPGATTIRDRVDMLGTKAFMITKADLLEKIATRRVVSLLTSDFGRMTRVFPSLKYFSSAEQYTRAIGHVTLSADVQPSDRMVILASAIFKMVEASPFELIRLMDSFEITREFSRRVLVLQNQAQPVSSMLALDHLITQLGQAGRGQYIYAHILLPHFEYIYDRDCRPDFRIEGSATENLAPWIRPTRLLDGDTEKRVRTGIYRQYVDQVFCVQKKVLQLLDVVDANPALRDATVILHGDHGARINFNSADLWEQTGGTRGAFERDWRGALIAVRSPDMKPGRVARPALLTEVFSKLEASDFRGFDPNTLQHADQLMQGP